MGGSNGALPESWGDCHAVVIVCVLGPSCMLSYLGCPHNPEPYAYAGTLHRRGGSCSLGRYTPGYADSEDRFGPPSHLGMWSYAGRYMAPEDAAKLARGLLQIAESTPCCILWSDSLPSVQKVPWPGAWPSRVNVPWVQCAVNGDLLPVIIYPAVSPVPLGREVTSRRRGLRTLRRLAGVCVGR